tara:strand:- start:245 stop:556 length:312 start_codon:yes stop_codon:yes gene_type:complete
MENVIKFDLNKMGSSDIQSMNKVINAYIQIEPINYNFYGISETGFNENSGYVYIALENQISICSAFNNEVEYLVTNFDNGEEFFFETYEEAKAKNLKVNDISY